MIFHTMLDIIRTIFDVTEITFEIIILDQWNFISTQVIKNTSLVVCAGYLNSFAHKANLTESFYFAPTRVL